MFGACCILNQLPVFVGVLSTLYELDAEAMASVLVEYLRLLPSYAAMLHDPLQFVLWASQVLQL